MADQTLPEWAETPAGEGLEDTEWPWPGTPPYNHGGSTDSAIELGSEASEDTMDETASLINSSETEEGEEAELGDAGQGVDPQSGVLGNMNAALRHTHNAYKRAPDIELAAAALDVLIKLLVPDRVSDRHLDPFEGEKLLRKQMNMVKDLLMLYTVKRDGWIAASLTVARLHRRSAKQARSIWKWARRFLADQDNLPISSYGTWAASMLDRGELAREIHDHLQAIGKTIRAQDIVEFLAQDEIKMKYNL
jgi:hypothetical protein